MGRRIVRIPLYDQRDDVKILICSTQQYSDDVVMVIESANEQKIEYRAGNIKEVVRICNGCDECEHMYLRFFSGSEVEIEKISFAYFPTTYGPEINQTALQELLQA